MDIDLAIHEAVGHLRSGGLIAYPTEAVFGLGCDPFNPHAVARLLALKNRSIKKGLILIAASWTQIENLVQAIPPQALARVLSSWPGHTTYAFPARTDVPEWIRGNHDSIALRVTEHPIAAKLCDVFGGPIVSTSANREGDMPLRDARAVQLYFADELDYIVKGRVGGHTKPSMIRDAVTDRVLRE